MLQEAEMIASQIGQIPRPRQDVSHRRVYTLLIVPFWLVAASTVSAQAQDLPQCSTDDAPVQIEVLPFNATGNTCDGSSNVDTYGGPACRIPNVHYFAKEVTYKVWLHEGNQGIHFLLDVQGQADLVLAVTKCRSRGDTCVNSSPDFIGSRDEEILAASYNPPGFYYLYVDSVEGHCGAYELTVTGDNPTPDLLLDLISSPVKPRPQHPNAAVAGEKLIYTLKATNVGRLDATDVKVIQCLPPGVTLVEAETDDECQPTVDSDCQGFGSTVACGLGSLAKINGQASKRITVLVDPQNRGKSNGAGTHVLTSKAVAKAKEGNPPTGNNRAVKETEVIAESDLIITLTSSPAHDAVAGEPLIYTLRTRNEGPSTANNIVITENLLDLLGDVEFVSSAPPCERQAGTVTCRVSKIAPLKDVVHSITLTIKSSTAHGKALVNTATVSATEPEPVPNLGPNSATTTTNVVRKTALSITKTGPTEKAAGEELFYELTVCNCGPSASGGAIITDTLPPGVKFGRSETNCQPQGTGKVTCTIDEAIVRSGCSAEGRCDGSVGNKYLSFTVGIDSSLSPTILTNTATVARRFLAEQDQSRGIKTDSWETSVTVDANLHLLNVIALNASDLLPANSVVAGGNLVYEVTVKNEGPSDAKEVVIKDGLQGFTFVASPDGCQGSSAGITCPVKVLRKDEMITRRFLVKVNLSFSGTSLSNHVCVQSDTHDRFPENDCSNSTPSILVEQKADLKVALSDSPDPVDLSMGGNLLYTVHVTNAGPSNASNVKVSLQLPGTPTSLPIGCNSGTGVGSVECTLTQLAPGKAPPLEISITAPGTRGTAIATASVTSGTTDPNPGNNTATETTTLADHPDSDIVITKNAGVDAVVAGDLITYKIEAVNRGPVGASNVVIQDDLPSGTTFVSAVASPPCDNLATGPVVTCSLDTLAKGNPQSVTLVVKVNSDFLSDSVTNTAMVTPSSPNPDNNVATVKTPVLHVAPLVLPFFKLDAADINTLLAVRNPSAEPLGVRLDYFLAGQPSATSCETRCLKQKQIFTRSLNDVFSEAVSGLREGYVGITPIPPPLSGVCTSTSLNDCEPNGPPSLLTPAPVPPLSGDFIRIEPANGQASGQSLVSTDTSRVPPEFCQRWSTRFLNGGTFLGNTEFVFFVPGNPPSVGPVVVGKVYDENGTLFQKISIEASGEAFRRMTTMEQTSGDKIGLLPSFGVIEWEFPPGVVGNISAIHRNQDKYAVAVPGFCRRPPSAEALGTEPDLIIPYFTVNPQNGATTLFAVHNESEREVMVQYQYFAAGGTRQYTETLPLIVRGTRTVNLRDLRNSNIPELQGLTQGYIQIGVAGNPVHYERILSGDFVRIDPAHGMASGGALVDTDLQRSPRQLCRKWNVRFLQGGPLMANTEFVFYIDNIGVSGQEAMGESYDEQGKPKGGVKVPISGSAFTASISDPGLRLTGNGSIEWDLGESRVGNLASVFKAGGLSVLVPGVCIQ